MESLEGKSLDKTRGFEFVFRCRLKLHLFLRNPTSADDKSRELFLVHGSSDFDLYIIIARLCAAYDNRLREEERLNVRRSGGGVYGVMGILISEHNSFVDAHSSEDSAREFAVKSTGN